MELIFHSVDTFFSVKWLGCFLENWWPGVHEILEIVVLIHPIATTLVVTTLNIVGNGTQKIFHVLLRLFDIALTSKKLRKEYLCSERWRRRQMWFRVWLIMVDVVFTTPTCPGSITTSPSAYFSNK
jgi:hypothetical protein